MPPKSRNNAGALQLATPGFQCPLTQTRRKISLQRTCCEHPSTTRNSNPNVRGKTYLAEATARKSKSRECRMGRYAGKPFPRRANCDFPVISSTPNWPRRQYPGPLRCPHPSRETGRPDPEWSRKTARNGRYRPFLRPTHHRAHYLAIPLISKRIGAVELHPWAGADPLLAAPSNGPFGDDWYLMSHL